MTAGTGMMDAFAGRHFAPLAACVVLLGVFLRARRLRLKGLFLWDEATYYREVIVVGRLLDFYRRRWRELLQARLKRDADMRERLVEEYKEDYKLRFDYVWYKVWHTALTYITCSVVKQADFAMCLPAFFMGSAGILLAVWMGREVAGPAAGLLSGLCLAVGGMHVMHSRSAEPETGVSFCLQFALAFVLLHQARSGGSALLLAGAGLFFCGISMFNPAWFVIVAPLAAVIVAASAFTGGYTPAAAASAAVSIWVFIALAVLLVNIPFFINGWLLPENGIRNTLHRYYQWLESFLTVVGLVKAPVVEAGKVVAAPQGKGEFCGVRLTAMRRLMFYPELLLRTEGPAFPAAVLGFAVVASSGRPAGAMVAAATAFMFAVITFSPLKSSRAVVVVTPLLAVLAGAFIASLPPVAAAPLSAAIAVFGIAGGLKISSLTSGVRKASEFIRSRGGANFLCTSGPFSILYGDLRTDYSIPAMYGSIYMYLKKYDADYLFVEHHELYPSNMLDDTVEIITKEFEPVFTAEDPCVTHYPLLAEAEFINSSWRGIDADAAFGTGEQIARWNRFRMSPSDIDRTVRVYDIKSIFQTEKARNLFYGKQFAILVRMYSLGEEPDVLIPLLQELFVLKPDDANVMYYIAGCLHKSGKYDLAMQAFEIVSKEESADEDKRKWCRVHMFNCGVSAGRDDVYSPEFMGEIDALLDAPMFQDDFRESTRLKMFLGRASLLCMEKRYEDALKLSNERLAKHPDCPNAGFYRAIGMIAGGMRQEGVREMRALLDRGVLPAEFLDTARQLAG